MQTWIQVVNISRCFPCTHIRHRWFLCRISVEFTVQQINWFCNGLIRLIIIVLFWVSDYREDSSHCECVVRVDCEHIERAAVLPYVIMCNIVANRLDFTPLRLLFRLYYPRISSLTGWMFEIVLHFRKANNEITFSYRRAFMTHGLYPMLHSTATPWT